jgi:hypothetical protein
MHPMMSKPRWMHAAARLVFQFRKPPSPASIGGFSFSGLPLHPRAIDAKRSGPSPRPGRAWRFFPDWNWRRRRRIDPGDGPSPRCALGFAGWLAPGIQAHPERPGRAAGGGTEPHLVRLLGAAIEAAQPQRLERRHRLVAQREQFLLGWCHAALDGDEATAAAEAAVPPIAPPSRVGHRLTGFCRWNDCRHWPSDPGRLTHETHAPRGPAAFRISRRTGLKSRSTSGGLIVTRLAQRRRSWRSCANPEPSRQSRGEP